MAEVTWVGHATVLVEIGDARVLTDPVLSHRLGHLRRRTAPPAERVRQVDLVLISHAHADHLHRRSLRLVAAASPGATVVVPRGAARFLRGIGLTRVVEVAPGDSLDVAGVRLGITPAAHSPRRGRLDHRTATAVGYLVQHGGRRLYFAGDTDLFEGMADIGPVDLAAMPISGWWKRLGPGHLDEARAAVAVERIAATRVLPIHWGTFSPEDFRGGLPAWLPETGRRFERELTARGLRHRLVRLEPGQTARW